MLNVLNTYELNFFLPSLFIYKMKLKQNSSKTQPITKLQNKICLFKPGLQQMLFLYIIWKINFKDNAIVLKNLQSSKKKKIFYIYKYVATILLGVV